MNNAMITTAIELVAIISRDLQYILTLNFFSAL